MTPGTEHWLVIIGLIGAAVAGAYGLWKFLFNSSYESSSKPLQTSIDALNVNVKAQTVVLDRVAAQYDVLDGKVDQHTTDIARHETLIEALKEKES